MVFGFIFPKYFYIILTRNQMIRLRKHKYPGNSAFCLQETGQYKKGSQNFYSTKVFLSRGSIFVKMEMNQDEFLIYLNKFLFLIYVG